MRRMSTGWLAVGILALAPSVLVAQAICGGRVAAPAEGGYAEYRMKLPDGNTQTVRFAVVGHELREGTKNIWFETRVQVASKPMVVSQVLVPGFPYDPSALVDAALQLPNGVPVKLSANQVARGRRHLPGMLQAIVDGCKSASLVGQETVKVAGGAFRAQHYRNALRGSDIWVSSDVPFGIVKLTDGADKTTMELFSAGTTAKSSFSAPPKAAGEQGPS